MADPLSVADKSTRDPWTDGGAEPEILKEELLKIIFKVIDLH